MATLNSLLYLRSCILRLSGDGWQPRFAAHSVALAYVEHDLAFDMRLLLAVLFILFAGLLSLALSGWHQFNGVILSVWFASGLLLALLVTPVKQPKNRI